MRHLPPPLYISFETRFMDKLDTIAEYLKGESAPPTSPPPGWDKRYSLLWPTCGGYTCPVVDEMAGMGYSGDLPVS